MSSFFFPKNRGENIETPLEKSLKQLMELRNKKEIPSLIPKLALIEHENGNFYKFDNYCSTLEKFLKNQHQNLEKDLSCLTFSEIFSFFQQLINGLTFLEINNLTMKIDVSSFFISQKNYLKCNNAEKLVDYISKEAIKSFGVLILHFSTFLDCEKIEWLIKNDFPSIEALVEKLKRNYEKQIEKKEELKNLQIFIKILKQIFEITIKEDKKLYFFDLFSELLKSMPSDHLEHIISITEANCFNFEISKILKN